MIDQGDIILIRFPFTDLSQTKVRPALVITRTKDKYQDLVICAISSIVPEKLGERELLISDTEKWFGKTGLRVNSVVKVDRLATLREIDVITRIGECPPAFWKKFAKTFCDVVKSKSHLRRR